MGFDPIFGAVIKIHIIVVRGPADVHAQGTRASKEENLKSSIKLRVACFLSAEKCIRFVFDLFCESQRSETHLQIRHVRHLVLILLFGCRATCTSLNTDSRSLVIWDLFCAIFADTRAASSAASSVMEASESLSLLPTPSRSPFIVAVSFRARATLLCDSQSLPQLSRGSASEDEP